MSNNKLDKALPHTLLERQKYRRQTTFVKNGGIDYIINLLEVCKKADNARMDTKTLQSIEGILRSNGCYPLNVLNP